MHIKDSDFKHSGIEALSDGPVVNSNFSNDYFISPGGYRGPYDNGKLSAQDRRKLLFYAHSQVGKNVVYDQGDKDPKRIKLPGVSFRCDGYIEYAYEKIKYVGLDHNGQKCSGFFSDEEEMECWIDRKNVLALLVSVCKGIWAAFANRNDAFFPKALMSRMTKAEYQLPQIPYFKVYQEGEEIKEERYITATFKIYATDGDNGSGIDRVEKLVSGLILLQKNTKIS